MPSPEDWNDTIISTTTTTTTTDDDDDEEEELVQKSLRDKIAEEERNIRILEAEWNVVRLMSTGEKKNVSSKLDKDKNDWEEDHYLLKILDALQCSATVTIGNDELDSDNDAVVPSIVRTNPIWSGLKFDKVSGTWEDHNNKVIYSLDGTVMCVKWSFVVDISVTPSLFHLNQQQQQQHHCHSTTNTDEKTTKRKQKQQQQQHRANLSQLLVKFHTTQTSSFSDEETLFFPKEELAELERISSHLCSLTFMFREVTCFADFHSNVRVPTIQRIQQQQQQQQQQQESLQGLCQFSVLSAHLFRFTILSVSEWKPVFTLELSWKWIFSPLGGGGSNCHPEELKISQCFGTDQKFSLEQEGLDDLVYIAGSSSEAIQILWQMFLSLSTKKKRKAK